MNISHNYCKLEYTSNNVINLDRLKIMSGN